MPRSARGAVVLAEHTPPTRARRWVGRLVVTAVVALVGLGGWLGVRHLTSLVSGPVCTATASGTTFEWAPDQASNAAVITAIGLRRGLPARAATIALATAMQESKVRNIRYGDRDSVGLFQQRPSQGWGTVEQIMNPEYSTNRFYDALVKVKGWQSMDIAKAAQAVQRSADGALYAQHEAQARVTASALAGYSPEGIACALEDPAAPGTTAAVAALVSSDHGLRAKVAAAAGGGAGGTVTVSTADARTAWAVGGWAVARAVDAGVTRVVVGTRQWTRGMEESSLAWQDATTPTGASTVVITVGAP